MTFEYICCIYPTETECISNLEQIRWIGTPICPYCGQTRTSSRSSENRHRCLECRSTFSVTTKTVFHHSHIPLRKWLCAIMMIREGCCIRAIARETSVNKNTAWKMQMRVHEAMKNEVQRQFLERIVVRIQYLRRKDDENNKS